MNTAYEAMIFAMDAHKNQKRKYTGNPYFEHLAEVAGIVACVMPSHQEAIAVSWLHDCIEDCSVSIADLLDRFSSFIVAGVVQLSDMEKGNRAERKAMSRIRLASAPGWIQTIKVADLISNTSSIVHHDPSFAKLYLEEKRMLLDVLTKADPRLIAIARSIAGNTDD